MPTYSILEGYVHKNDGDLEWKAHLKGFLTCIGVFLMILTYVGAFISYFCLTRKSLMMYDPLGK